MNERWILNCVTHLWYCLVGTIVLWLRYTTHLGFPYMCQVFPTPKYRLQLEENVCLLSLFLLTIFTAIHLILINVNLNLNYLCFIYFFLILSWVCGSVFSVYVLYLLSFVGSALLLGSFPHLLSPSNLILPQKVPVYIHSSLSISYLTIWDSPPYF